jgi:AcrR family transcriptional regulator
MSSTAQPRRMSPDARREQLLRVARAQVADRGLAQFSLEDVAREAGVVASLPRHYFGSRDGLLLAVATEIIEEVIAVLGAPRGRATLTERLVAYLDILSRDPWVHHVWMQASEYSEDLHRRVVKTRRRLAELSFDVRWKDLSPRERLALLGWGGYFEAVISGWIEQGVGDRTAVIEALAEATGRLGVKGV